MLYRHRKRNFENGVKSLKETLAAIDCELAVVKPMLDKMVIGFSEVLRLERECADAQIQLAYM